MGYDNIKPCRIDTDDYQPVRKGNIMKPEYKIITKADGIQRVYYTHEFYAAMALANMFIHEMGYAEAWEGTRLIQKYDSLSQLLD